MDNIQITLMSQYANSPIICGLIECLNDCIDPTKTLDSFYDLAGNVHTAQGFGLDLWGRIVGVSRNVPLQNPNTKVFGFSNKPQKQSPRFTPFNNAPFTSSGTGFNTYSLPDYLYRTLILFKAAVNLLHATALNINKLLKSTFNKTAYFLITGTMQAKYQFHWKLDSFERMIVYTLALLPEPCGVEVTYEEIY